MSFEILKWHNEVGERDLNGCLQEQRLVAHAVVYSDLVWDS